jgi:hypothetical protein
MVTEVMLTIGSLFHSYTEKKMITLTQNQLNVLNFKVLDGQAWANHAESKFGLETGTKFMLEKVEKYKQSYLDAQGDGYKTRKQRLDAGLIAEQERYDNVSWDVKRQREYPTIAELVVALYDTDDKVDIDRRRAEVKAKYPKL